MARNVIYALIFLGSILLYLRIGGDDPATVTHLGFICSFGSMIMFGSPLVTVVLFSLCFSPLPQPQHQPPPL